MSNNVETSLRNVYTNNIEDMKEVVQKLEQHHDKLIVDNKKPKPCLLTVYVEDIIGLEDLEKYQIDKATLLAEASKLEHELEQMLISPNLVESVCGFDFTEGKYTPMPPVYNILMCLFAFTDEDFRRCSLIEIIKNFYKRLNQNLSKPLVKMEYEKQINILLPVVKMQVASFLIKSKGTAENSKRLEEVLSNLSCYLKYPQLNKEDCYEVLKNKLHTTDYDLLEYKIIPIVEKNGYLGNYFRLEIKTVSSGLVEDHKMFVKFIDHMSVFKDIGIEGSRREHFFYMTVMRQYESLGLAKLLDFAPQHYLIREFDVVILEDLKSLGFVALRGADMIPYEELRLTVLNIAKLHACSLITEEVLSKEKGASVRLDELYGKDYFGEVFEMDANLLKWTVIGNLYLIEKFPNIAKKLSIEEFKARTVKAFQSSTEKAQSSKRFRNVLCHGDLYLANIMIRYGQNNVPLQSRIVDFQLLRYCPPAHDLLFFIYMNSTKKTRDKYYNQLLQDYYQALSKHLTDFGMDVGSIYSPEEFNNCCEYMKSQALCLTLVYSHFNKCAELRELVFGGRQFQYLYDERKKFIDFAMENETFRSVHEGLLRDLYDICENNNI